LEQRQTPAYIVFQTTTPLEIVYTIHNPNTRSNITLKFTHNYVVFDIHELLVLVMLVILIHSRCPVYAACCCLRLCRYNCTLHVVLGRTPSHLIVNTVTIISWHGINIAQRSNSCSCMFISNPDLRVLMPVIIHVRRLSAVSLCSQV